MEGKLAAMLYNDMVRRLILGDLTYHIGVLDDEVEDIDWTAVYDKMEIPMEESRSYAC